MFKFPVSPRGESINKDFLPLPVKLAEDYNLPKISQSEKTSNSFILPGSLWNIKNPSRWVALEIKERKNVPLLFQFLSFWLLLEQVINSKHNGS